MAYCSANAVMELLGIESGSDVWLIQTMVNAAQAAIDRYCHRTFEASEDTTRYVDARGDHLRGATLYIDHVGELASITSITNGNGEVLAASDYVTTPRFTPPFYAIRLKTQSGKLWQYDTDWENAIAITGRWAYSVTAPEPISLACAQLAAFYFRQKDQPFADVTAVEAGVVMRPMGIPAHVRAILDNGYRKP